MGDLYLDRFLERRRLQVEYDEKYRIHQESLTLARRFRAAYRGETDEDAVELLEQYRECRRRLPIDERRSFKKLCRYRASEAYMATQGAE